jgi:hypothetical protein
MLQWRVDLIVSQNSTGLRDKGCAQNAVDRDNEPATEQIMRSGTLSAPTSTLGSIDHGKRRGSTVNQYEKADIKGQRLFCTITSWASPQACRVCQKVTQLRRTLQPTGRARLGWRTARV